LMKRLLVTAVGIALLFAAPARADGLKVVTTIGPLHSLTAAVMAGVGTPTLLVRGGMSPHTFTLRPSDAKAIEEASLVFWFGETLEPGLARAIRALPRGEVISLLSQAPLSLLPAREGGPWEEEDEDGHGHDHAHGDDDPHVWLDPRNGAVLASYIAKVLSRSYPDHAARFTANADALQDRLEALERDLAARLTPINEAPYLVFHDAYQYFERRFDLRPVGSITVNPERAPGGQRLSALRERLVTSGARCVFQEPQFESRAVAVIVEGTATKVGVLDPLGAELEPGPEAYPTLLRRLADNLTACLAAS
jgi:zinc transport system substrate-binding protein